MPRYYTPKAAIRFANQDAVAFKKLAMTVETVIHCVSDHGLQGTFYSGVIRYRRDDWKRYTVVWLYGDSVGSDTQDFVQPSISDVSCSTYYENYRITSPAVSDQLALTGSNFVSGTAVYLEDRLTPSTFVSRNYIIVSPTGWFGEQANVPITVVRPDYRSSTNDSLLSYEYRPTVTSLSQTGSYIDGGVAIGLNGTRFKDNSNVSFSSGTGTWWSDNFTRENSVHAGFFSPAVPATGIYALHVESPSGLTSQQSVNVTVSYHRPEITALLPFNTGSIAGSTPIAVVGSYFLAGATVLFDGLPVLSQSDATPTLIDVLTPPHAVGNIGVTVTNPQDGQVSLPYSYAYVIPLPTITDARFSGTTVSTQKTGSAGSILYITGTNFTGSDALMTVGKVTIVSGAFISASTIFTINGPTEIQYEIGVLVPSSRYDVEVSNSAGTAYLSQAFEYQDFPVVLSVLPVSGTTAGGLPVSVTGRPFYSAGASQVKFSGVLGANQLYFNPTQISAQTPPATNQDGERVEVSVQNFGSLEGGLANAFEYVPFPTASSVSSPAGPGRVAAETGGTLYLNGTRLMASSGGALGTVITTDFEASIPTSFINSTRVSFNVQPHAAAFCALTATNRNIATGDPLALAIEYVNTPTITSLSPSAVVYTGGTTVGVTGTNFINSTDTVVMVGTTEVAATVVNPTHLTFVVPSLVANTYAITVKNRQTTISNAVNLQLIAQPTISSLSTVQGVNTGNTYVVVNGSGFLSGTTAVFSGRTFPGGGTLAVSYISPTQISFYTPATSDVRGYATLTVSVLGLTAVATNAFFYEQQPTISTLSPTTALAAGSTTVSVTGSGFVNGITTIDVDSVTVANTFVNTSLVTFVAPAHAIGGPFPVKAANTFLSSTVNTLRYAALPPPAITYIQVGSILCDTSDQAKWSTAGGAAHPSSWTDKLLGTNFTAGDTLVVVPYDTGAPMYPAFTFVNSTEIWFSMPAYPNSTQGYLYLTNVNGTSNYGIFRWNRVPTVSSLTPDIGWYNADQVITVNGTNFVNGQTFVFTDPGFITRVPATVVNSTLLYFTLPTAGNPSTDRTVKNMWVANSTSMGGEAYVYTGLYKTVNPPYVTLIDPNTALTDGTTYLNTYASDNTYMATQVHIFQYDSGVWTDLGLTNLAGTYVADLRLAPARAAGTSYRALGYTANNGTQILGLNKPFTYYVAPPLTVTLTNTYSDASIGKPDGYMGSVLVTTSPRLYAAIAGGVAPYTALLELVSTDPASTGPAVALQYALSGWTYNARGYGTISYGDEDIWNLTTYRWKVTDNVGTIVYSSNVQIQYEIYPNSFGPTCVIPTTPILMAGGTSKLAGEISVGDTVLTYPEAAGSTELVEAKVTHASSNQNRTVRVEFTDGRSLVCSYNHRLATRDGWLEAEQLFSGRVVLGTVPGTVSRVTPNGVREVIKLTIAGAKTYISDGLLSHNEKIGP